MVRRRERCLVVVLWLLCVGEWVVSELFADQAYEVVRLVPAGQVVTYGDLGELFGRSPRHVGRVMSGCGGRQVPWWRVVNASGRLPGFLLVEAAARWRAEGMVLRDDGCGVVLRLCRADLVALGDVIEASVGELPGLRRGSGGGFSSGDGW
ncbi:Predicted methylated DNA-protein cysteine methyltransferase [Dermatophilus congolensis]|uniref:Predicted methylated DNA-protein cysteine methyltransferase n=1 Tax=Dermatophilus congolensis TaxID=1863 RepID=A0AA46BN21_9MICO|nr:Predicted methylated DNA-protein cysteine methyltransferase [Dermatophilus congolensis]